MTKPIFIVSCLVLSSLAATVATAQLPAATKNSQLQITLDLEKQLSKDSLDYLTPFHVVIANTGKEPIRIWNPHKLPGRNLWTIEFKQAGVEKPFVVRYREYHDSHRDDEQVASASETTEEELGKIITLQPGRKFLMQVLLSETQDEAENTAETHVRQLNWQGLPHPCAPGDFQLSMTYDSPAAPDAAANQVWTGRITSPEIKTRLFAHRLLTPHRLLEHHFSQAAFEMLKADPKKWVRRREGEEKRMPLHLAVMRDQLEIVEWLVEHGAPVDATTAYRETPLELATQPVILQALLKACDDLDNREGERLLFSAACEAANASSDESKKRTRKIVRMLRAAGARESLDTAIYLNELEGAKRFIKAHPQPDDRWSPESSLRLAIDYQRVEICQLLMDTPGIDLDDTKDGNTPIIADALMHPEIVKLFIERKVKLSKELPWHGGRFEEFFDGKATLLHYAARGGTPETIKLLIDNGLSIFAVTHAGQEDLNLEGDQREEDIEADVDRDVDEIEIDMEAFFDVEVEHQFEIELDAEFQHPILALIDGQLGGQTSRAANQTALDYAARAGKGDNVIAIMQHPKFKAAPDLVRWDALNRACTTLAGALDQSEGGDVHKWFTTLAAAGADIPRLGHLAIQNAASHISPFRPNENKRFREAIATLLELGAEIDFPSAVAYGDETLVAALLAKSPEQANAVSEKGLPALHLAVFLELPKTVNLLLESGANVNLRNQGENHGAKGETALAVAAHWGLPSIAKLLIEHDADINAGDLYQRTPLMRAVSNQKFKAARLLLENGAKIDIQDSEGRTLEQIAEDDKQLADLLDEFRPSSATK